MCRRIWETLRVVVVEVIPNNSNNLPEVVTVVEVAAAVVVAAEVEEEVTTTTGKLFCSFFRLYSIIRLNTRKNWIELMTSVVKIHWKARESEKKSEKAWN